MRTKRLIVVLTIPNFNNMDSQGRQHINTIFEAVRVHKKENLVETKMLRYQPNPRFGKEYYKYYYDIEGNKEERTFFTKPPKDLIKVYEKKRAEFLNKSLDESLSEIKAFKEKELEKTTGFDVTKIVEEVWKNKEDYLKEVKGQKWVDYYLIMERFKVGHMRARRVRAVIEQRLKANA